MWRAVAVEAPSAAALAAVFPTEVSAEAPAVAVAQVAVFLAAPVAEAVTVVVAQVAATVEAVADAKSRDSHTSTRKTIWGKKGRGLCPTTQPPAICHYSENNLRQHQHNNSDNRSARKGHRTITTEITSELV